MCQKDTSNMKRQTGSLYNKQPIKCVKEKDRRKKKKIMKTQKMEAIEREKWMTKSSKYTENRLSVKRCKNLKRCRSQKKNLKTYLYHVIFKKNKYLMGARMTAV